MSSEKGVRGRVYSQDPEHGRVVPTDEFWIDSEIESSFAPETFVRAVLRRAQVAEGEAERLREALKSVQWLEYSGTQSSVFPRCVGCSAVRYGHLSTVPHNYDCVIEAALKSEGES